MFGVLLPLVVLGWFLICPSADQMTATLSSFSATAATNSAGPPLSDLSASITVGLLIYGANARQCGQ